MTAVSSAARLRTRRAGVWAAIAAALVLVGALGAVIVSSNQWTERERFDPESAGPDGTRALARILEQNGVPVDIVRDRHAARGALAEGAATLVLPDSPLLSDETFTELADAATDVVVAEPRSRSIRLLFDGRIDGYGDTDPVAPACALPDADRAGTIVVGATIAAGSAGCYPVGDAFGLVWEQRGQGRAVAVDGSELFTNARLAENGNAALALNLLGAQPRVVWYVPALGDADPGEASSLGELTPGWVSPVILLAMAAALAAALWRGRRFGPLVRERLPVTVRGTETTRGRGRLYASSHDAGHAARILAAGSTGRLARSLGLAPTAPAETVVDAVAARLRRDRDEVRRALVPAPPRTDRELVELSHRLHDLEAALTAALQPGKDSP